MVNLYVKEIAILFGVWIIYIKIKTWLRWRSLRIWGDQYGCANVPTVKNSLPGGIERYAIFFTGLEGLDLLEDLIRNSFKQMDRHSFRAGGFFNTSYIMTDDPANVQAVLSTKFADFGLGAERTGNFQSLLGHGIFTADGASWQHFRSQLKPQFTRDQVSDLEAADRHLQLLFDMLPRENEQGVVEAADLKPLIFRFTLDTSTEFLLGTSLHSQTKTGKEIDDFNWALKFALDFTTLRIHLGSLWWLKTSSEFTRACNIVKSFTEKFVYRALSAPLEKGKSGKFVLLDALVAETRDPDELRDQILQILMAGRDTTSALLCWTILLLSRHPLLYAELRAAILAQFPHGAEINFSSLKACKPLTHVIYETLRLYPVVPMNQRVALRNTVLPTGGGENFDQPIAIMKGETVVYSTYVMHRREDIWGPDCDEFRPSRWEGRKLGWEMLPFNGGPRVCIGRLTELEQYALNEASFVLVKMLQRYERIEALDMGPESMKKDVTLTLAPANGVNVRLVRAKE